MEKKKMQAVESGSLYMTLDAFYKPVYLSIRGQGEDGFSRYIGNNVRFHTAGRRFVPVSYTHLDVYKRQDEYAVHIVRSSDYMIGLVNSLIEFYLLDAGKGKMNVTVFRPLSLFDEIVTVSYTHLDVYKRQHDYRFRGCRRLSYQLLHMGGTL